MATFAMRTRSVVLAALLAVSFFQRGALGEERWRAEFDETCAKTSQAMTLSVEELASLVQRCSALEKVIEHEEESVRKVYLKRLALCKNLYAYVLDYKKNAQSAK